MESNWNKFRCFIKNKLIFCIYLFLLTNSALAQHGFVIDGNIRGVDSGSVMLKYWNSDGKYVKSVVKIVNGSFTLIGTVNEPNRAIIMLNLPNELRPEYLRDYSYFFIENSKITITGSSLKKAKIMGSNSQKDYTALGLNSIYLLRDSLGLSRLKNLRSVKPDIELNNKLIKQDDIARKMQIGAENKFIKSNKCSYVTLDILMRKSKSKNTNFSESIFEGICDKLKDTFTWKRMLEKLNSNLISGVGKSAAHFVQPDMAGKAIDVSSLKGKYLLIEFWASWCGPCRVENPNLVKVYNEFKGENFEIVGISVDDKRDAWINAIKQDKLPWIQVSDLRGLKENSAAKAYAITSVPINYLIDPEGVIVAVNLQGEHLAKKLREIIGSPAKKAELKVQNFLNNKEWEKFDNEVMQYMKTYGDSVSPQTLNNWAWAIFENSSDMNAVGKALSWSKISVIKTNNYEYMDTYANILYKMGRKEEAIEWEQKALNLAAGDKSVYQQTIDKFKRGEKTWKN